MTRSGNSVIAWEEIVYFRPTNTGMVRSSNRLAFDCSGGSYRVLLEVYYKADGTSDTQYSSAPAMYPPPDTTSESELRFVCSDRSIGVRLNGVPPDEDAQAFSR